MMFRRRALPSSSGATCATRCHVLEDHGMNPHHLKSYYIILYYIILYSFLFTMSQVHISTQKLDILSFFVCVFFCHSLQEDSRLVLQL